MLELNGTIIAVILNFIILVWALNYFLYGPVQSMLAERKKIVTSTIDEAEKNLQQANDIKAKYEAQLTGAASQAQEIIKNASASAEKMKNDLFIEAKKEAENIRVQGEKEAENIKTQTFASVKGSLSQLICDAASKLIKRSVSQDDHRELIEDMINNIDKAKLN